jgi:light-regulated signal transduction histidine kinase (bacteriophytochrome)
LRHIDGFLELLRRNLSQPLDHQSQHYLKISDAARRMGALIDDLLSSRAWPIGNSKTTINLDGLIEDVIREVEPDIQGRKVKWKIDDLPPIVGDRAMMRVVFTNLFTMP